MAPLVFDPADPATVADPFPLFRRLQREAPVSWSEPLRGWVVVRHADVQAALLDPRLSSDRVSALVRRLPAAERPRFDRFRRLFAASIAFSDPPAQQRRKVAVKGAFDRARARDLAGVAQEIAGELLAPARARGALEVVGDLARPLGCRVLARALGVADDAFAALHALAGDALLFAGRGRAPDRLERGRIALEALADALEAICAGGGDGAAADGWIAALLAAEGRGELDREEVVAIALNLVLAGEENVRHGIALGLWTLLRRPEALARWRAEPALRGPGVDELLRFDGPTQAIARLAAGDLELGGQAIRAGDPVYLFLNAANRDPARFPEPDRLDLARPDARAHLGFGAGIHRCVGQALARAEIGGALAALVDGLPGLALAGDPAPDVDSLTFRGFTRLPVTFTPVHPP